MWAEVVRLGLPRLLLSSVPYAMAVDQLMTHAGYSEVFDIGTGTTLGYALTPSQEAYATFQESTDGGTTWSDTSEAVLKEPESSIVPDQSPNTQYRVKLFGGVGTLRVQFDAS
jgi:hypothetical protein